MFDKFAILASFLPGPEPARVLAQRWSSAAQANPALVEDLIVLGRILAKHPAEFRDGREVPTPIDPSRVLMDAGRRELALELLALCKIDPATLATMTGDLD